MKTPVKERKKTHTLRNATVMAALTVLVALMGYFGMGPGAGGPGIGTGGDHVEETRSAAVAETAVPALVEEPAQEVSPTPAPIPSSVPEDVFSHPAPTETATPLPAEVSIRIEKDRIEADGADVGDVAALGGYIASVHADDVTYRLVDAHAYQNTYLAVKGLLDELGLDYTEGREG